MPCPARGLQELGLRDYAQFSGWIIPPAAAPAAPAAAPAAADAEAASGAAAAAADRPKGLSFAELAAGAPLSPAIEPLDAAELLQQAAAAEAELGDSYGYYNGINIGGGTRLDWIRDNIKPDPRVK